jgi:Xaa-Pro aminopeptidase
MFEERINTLRKKIVENEVDAFLVSNFFNILYLSDFLTLTPEEREAYILITKNKTFLFTDGRYLSEKLDKSLKKTHAVLKVIEVGKGLFLHLKEIVKEEGIKKLGFEFEDLKFDEYEKLHELSVELVPLKHVVSELREIKTPDEVAAMKRACELTDECLEDMVKIIKTGMTEKELAWKMEVWIREKGCELGFDPIVAVDENSAVPHYDTKTGNGTIRNGSVILLDFGIKYKNYISDITRMVFVGEQKDEVKKTYSILLEAQKKGLAAVQKDVDLKTIDAVCREHIVKNGLPNFMHSTGHGVGLEVHENPKVSTRSEEKVKVNQIFTIEPGVYFLGKYGMRIEDTIAVNADAKAIPLTQFSKEYFQIK